MVNSEMARKTDQEKNQIRFQVMIMNDLTETSLQGRTYGHYDVQQNQRRMARGGQRFLINRTWDYQIFLFKITKINKKSPKGGQLVAVCHPRKFWAIRLWNWWMPNGHCFRGNQARTLCTIIGKGSKKCINRGSFDTLGQTSSSK
jgi:hypothetical protein